jgi:hypothetical protein
MSENDNNTSEENEEEPEGLDKATGPKGETATHAPTTPPAGDALPEPAPPSGGGGGTTGGTTGGGGGGTTPSSGQTTPSTGNLGSSGTPGGST